MTDPKSKVAKIHQKVAIVRPLLQNAVTL